MEFSAGKCHVLKIGQNGMKPGWEYELGNDKLQESEKEKTWEQS